MQLGIDRDGTCAGMPAREKRLDIFAAVAGDYRDSLAGQNPGIQHGGGLPRDTPRQCVIGMQRLFAASNCDVRRKAHRAFDQQPCEIELRMTRFHRTLARRRSRPK